MCSPPFNSFHCHVPLVRSGSETLVATCVAADNSKGALQQNTRRHVSEAATRTAIHNASQCLFRQHHTLRSSAAKNNKTATRSQFSYYCSLLLYGTYFAALVLLYVGGRLHNFRRKNANSAAHHAMPKRSIGLKNVNETMSSARTSQIGTKTREDKFSVVKFTKPWFQYFDRLHLILSYLSACFLACTQLLVGRLRPVPPHDRCRWGSLWQWHRGCTNAEVVYILSYKYVHCKPCIYTETPCRDIITPDIKLYINQKAHRNQHERLCPTSSMATQPIKPSPEMEVVDALTSPGKTDIVTGEPSS